MRIYYVPWSLVSTERLAKLRPITCKVFLALIAHNGPDGIFPTRTTLAAECNIDIRSVDTAVKELETAGLIIVTRKANRCNRYVLLEPGSGTCDVATSQVATSHVATPDAATVATCHVATIAPWDVSRTLSIEHEAGNTKHGAARVSPPAQVRADRIESVTLPEPAGALPVESSNTDIPTASDNLPSPALPLPAAAPPSNPLRRLAFWFGYGDVAGEDQPAIWHALKPSKTNWYHDRVKDGGLDATMSVEPSADPVAIAAWAWTSLQWARSQSGLPVVRPASDELMGRRGRPGILGDLLKQRDTKGAIDFISTAFTDSGVILAALKGLDKPPILDSGYLRHKLVVREVERLMQERTQTADVIYPGDEDMNVSYL